MTEWIIIVYFAAAAGGAQVETTKTFPTFDRCEVVRDFFERRQRIAAKISPGEFQPFAYSVCVRQDDPTRIRM